MVARVQKCGQDASKGLREGAWGKAETLPAERGLEVEGILCKGTARSAHQAAREGVVLRIFLKLKSQKPKCTTVGSRV